MKQILKQGASPKDDKLDFYKLITDDYECKKDCRNCPFPGAKCYQSKYERDKTYLICKQ
jgi:hypothetical protein